MKLSFDLDDLLIPGTKRFDVEAQGLFHRLLGTEPLRAGTVSLFRALRSEGHQIYIYTSSFRSPAKIRLNFLMHGLRLDGVYNKPIHDQKLKNYRLPCSKYPPMFNIDLHIDDSEGVKTEAERYHFNVLVIDENDKDWTTTVLRNIHHLSASFYF